MLHLHSTCLGRLSAPPITIMVTTLHLPPSLQLSPHRLFRAINSGRTHLGRLCIQMTWRLPRTLLVRSPQAQLICIILEYLYLMVAVGVVGTLTVHPRQSSLEVATCVSIFEDTQNHYSAAMKIVLNQGREAFPLRRIAIDMNHAMPPRSNVRIKAATVYSAGLTI